MMENDGGSEVEVVREVMLLVFADPSQLVNLEKKTEDL
jgi:hypothetical protein